MFVFLVIFFIYASYVLFKNDKTHNIHDNKTCHCDAQCKCNEQPEHRDQCDDKCKCLDPNCDPICECNQSSKCQEDCVCNESNCSSIDKDDIKDDDLNSVCSHIAQKSECSDSETKECEYDSDNYCKSEQHVHFSQLFRQARYSI